MLLVGGGNRHLAWSWQESWKRLWTQYTPDVASKMEGEDLVPTQPALPHTHLVPGSARACLASLHNSHSTAKPAPLGDWGGGP